MKIKLLSIMLICITLPLSADKYQTIVKGWSLGEWAEITGIMLNPETMEWQENENSPWASWDVEAIDNNRVDIVMPNGMRSRIEIKDGEYRDFGPVKANGEVGKPLIIPIIDSHVVSERDWKMLIQWPQRPGTPEDSLNDYSELTMAGDTFIWSNYIGKSTEELQRVTLSINKIKTE